MKRRRALRILGAATAAPLVIPGVGMSDLLALGRDVRASMEGPDGRALRTLSPARAAIVSEIAEMIIPETDTPGAAEAGVTEFIDTLLTGWLDDADRDAFLAGIDMVDDVARAAFGMDFMDCEPGSKLQIVAALDEAAHGGRIRQMRLEAAPDPAQPFFHDLKRFTLAGYFTSRPGLSALGYRMIPGAFEGCVLLDQYGAGTGR